ncbi:MAG: hypothetical protein QNM02_03790 [Acidimicrobiia bacterium]|nr:hypothetical protein [Acidimicrobiia bacterium]
MKAPLSRAQLSNLNPTLRMKLPFLIAAFLSFVFSVYLYFILDEESAGIFVGLWVPSIHSLGMLLLTPTVKVEPARVPVRS